MSFAVGFVKPLQFNQNNCSDCDPTSLDSVLEALRGTSKGKLPYPEPFDKNYSLSDICESKYIGDLSHVIEREGFKDEVSFVDDYENEVNFQNIFALEDEEDKSIYREDGELPSNLEHTPVGSLCPDADAWLSYRNALRSPHHSPEKHEDSASEDELDGTATKTLHAVSSDASDDGEQFSARVETLMSRIHIDQSLPAVLARIQFYQRAYVNRVASIHLQNMEELRHCREQQVLTEQQQLQQGSLKEKQMEAVLKKQNEKLVAEKAEAAEQRKQKLLARLGAEEEQRLQEQAEQQRLHHLHTKQEEKQKLIARMQESFETFSSALDTILKKIKKCDGVALPADTTTELNETLQQGSEVLHSATHADAAVLQLTAARVSGGLDMIAQLEQIIDARLSETNQAAAAETTSAVAAGTGACAEPEPLSLSSSHPTANEELAAAKKNFENLSTTHDIVAQLSSKLVETDSGDERCKLAHAISVVNKFHNDSDASNREKLHTLVNLITGNRCAAGSQQVQVSDPQSPAAMFVKEQLSSKLIALAHDKQVSSQAVYASLMLRLWAIDPLLRSLCLYQLYKTCPYLVPYIPERQDYNSIEEYHRALGFRHKDGGDREALDSYLKRMGSASQLFGRLVSVEVENTSVGPHLGWQFLSRMLVSPVRSAVTCCVMHGFLSTAGSMMIKVYGKQFHKLMYFVVGQFLPLAEKATLEGGEADLASMKTLLNNYLQSRTIPAPSEGYRALL